MKEVDFVSKKSHDGRPYNAAYIHFHAWHNNHATVNLQARVLDPAQEARIVYDDPWYWIVLENKAKKHTSGSRKVRLVLDIPQDGFITPVKQRSNKDFADMCRAPIKNKLVKKTSLSNSDEEFDLNFKELRRQLRFDAEMDAIEELIDEAEANSAETDAYLATFDKRYIQELEKENQYYRDLLQTCYNNVQGKIQHQHGVVNSELLYY